MLKQSLQQGMRQQLSPLQIQMIRMLESTSLEIEECIQQEIDDNPVLEEVDADSRREELPDENKDLPGENSTDDDADFNLSDYQSDDTPNYKLRANNYSDEEQRESPLSQSASLHDTLIEQLHMKSMPEEVCTVAEYVIGNVDRDGYLRREPQAMADDILFQTGKDTPPDVVEKAVTVVQSLEPAGIGAADLHQCLLLQLKRKPVTPSITDALTVLTDVFDDFSKHHYDKIMKRYNFSEDRMRRLVAEVVKLNPKPGNTFDADSEGNLQIIPDFMVENEEGELILSLNDKNVPQLAISQDYSDQLEEFSKNKTHLNEDSKNAALFIKQKIDSAKWFISSIKQRQETLRSTMQAIVNKQKEFFLTGDETKLRPMVLKDVAAVTGYDISTISRVSNSKYVQTDWGVFPLKFFFSESMSTDTGEEVSNTEIKVILRECVENENKREPYTDDQLAEILQQKGYIIARRTIAKYRKQLNIPVANQRRTL